MSQKELDRLKVLHEIINGHITQKQGTEKLKLCTRQIRRLIKRVEEFGDIGIVHGLRGKPSNHRTPEEIRKKVIKEVKEKYFDFGPTLISEKLSAGGIRLSRETLRLWLIEEGLHKRRRRKIRDVHVYRDRKQCFGEMVQKDTSEHEWLEGRGPQVYLIAMIDDATGHVTANFELGDTTENNMKLLKNYLLDKGRPQVIYTDGNSIFVTHREQKIDEQLKDEKPLTQYGRALKELGIEHIEAHSPQAKGRIERFFGTAQDRLVKELRLHNACTLKDANRVLHKVFLPMFNRRFTVAPIKSADLHMPISSRIDLDSILSIQETRKVANDYTFRIDGQRYQIKRNSIVTGLRGNKVVIEKRLDGSMWVRFRGKYLDYGEIIPTKSTTFDHRLVQRFAYTTCK